MNVILIAVALAYVAIALVVVLRDPKSWRAAWLWPLLGFSVVPPAPTHSRSARLGRLLLQMGDNDDVSLLLHIDELERRHARLPSEIMAPEKHDPNDPRVHLHMLRIAVQQALSEIDAQLDTLEQTLVVLEHDPTWARAKVTEVLQALRICTAPVVQGE